MTPKPRTPSGPAVDALREKLAAGRPVDINPAEAALLTDALRGAMAVTLEKDEAEITPGAHVFDELGLDSIDVFDILDQLAETFDVQVELEQLPEEMIYGGEGLTFQQFADGIVAHFRSAPEETDA